MTALPALPRLDLSRAPAPPYGAVEVFSPLIRRVTAKNPGGFTFHGTGTYIVGRGALAVIDPGPDDPAHINAILAATAGETITHILVTHTHMDHSPGARPLQAKTGAQIYAFGGHQGDGSEADVAVEEGADSAFAPDVVLHDGSVIAGPGFTFGALHTPGHMSNHLCFALAEERTLFTGDHVMGWSTSVVVPPDGHMDDYLASLARLAARDDAVLVPTHGGPIGGPHDPMGRQPQAFVRQLIDHRRAREAQILALLSAGAQSIPDMVRVIYAQVDARLHGAAGQSMLAHLISLERAGHVRHDGGAMRARIWQIA